MIAVVFTVYPLVPIVLPPVRCMAAMLIIAFGLGGLIKVLFFSLPKGTYTNPSEKRRVYSGGVYGLCRHPGFWPYVVFFTGLLIMFGKDLLILSTMLCILNFAYIVFQDVWTFRQIFEDYDDYRKQVPFLVPGISSFISGKK